MFILLCSPHSFLLIELLTPSLILISAFFLFFFLVALSLKSPTRGVSINYCRRKERKEKKKKAKSSRLSTKRNLSTLLNFLFPLVSFIGLFSFLKCKTLHLKATTWWTRASHFVDGWHLSPPPMWLPIWLLWGAGMGGLFWTRIFFPNLWS